jgi:hypothetical protein
MKWVCLFLDVENEYYYLNEYEANNFFGRSEQAILHPVDTWNNFLFESIIFLQRFNLKIFFKIS